MIIYRGPSLLDGAPIVAIATVGSRNAKTGDMVQTWIMRDDVKPLAAAQSGADASVCGDCKHRPISGGACYVNLGQGPRAVFADTYRIFVRTDEGAEFQAFTWCRDEASGIARAWREGREFGHNVTAVWAEAV